MWVDALKKLKLIYENSTNPTIITQLIKKTQLIQRLLHN